MSLVVYRGLQNESGGGLIVARKVVVKIQIFQWPKIGLPSLRSILLHPYVHTIAPSTQASGRSTVHELMKMDVSESERTWESSTRSLVIRRE